MIQPNLQKTLFETSKFELLEMLDLSANDLEKWHELGYLSSSFALKNELDAPDVLEIIFVSKLVKSLSNEIILNHLFNKLQKPYCYEYDKVYFDVFSDEWNYINFEKPLDILNIEDFLTELLDECDRVVQKNTISDLISLLSIRIKEL